MVELKVVMMEYLSAALMEKLLVETMEEMKVAAKVVKLVGQKEYLKVEMLVELLEKLKE
jgi:hypothetical protein